MAKRKTKKTKGNFAYDFVKITGFLPAFIWVRPRIIRENENVPKRIKGGVLMASNHVTFIDPIILHCALWYRRLYSIATKEVARTKLRKFLFETMHCILIDKENFSFKDLHLICDTLKEDKAVVIFPEGSVNLSENKEQEYKSGVVLMALLSQKPIVPICIIKGERWYSRVTVVIGEPIDVAKIYGPMPSMEQIEEISQILKDKVESLKAYKRKKRGN